MKKLVAALAVALLCAGFGASYLWRELRDVRSGNTWLQKRAEKLELPQRAASNSTAAALGAEATLVSSETATPPVNKEATSSPATDLNRAFTRAGLAQMYPDLAQELGLAPDEFDKLMDLLTTQHMNPAYDAKKREAYEAEIAAMLGSRYAQWQDYQQTLTGRQQVTQLRGELAASGSTMAETKARPLMVALSAEQKRIDQEARDSVPSPAANQKEAMERGVRQMTENNRRMVAAAAPYLSTQQLDSYRQLLDKQVATMRTMVVTMSAAQDQAGTAK